MASAWTRTRMTTGGGTAKMALIVLTDAALPDPLPVSRTRHGVPECETAAAVGLAIRERAAHAAWFEDLMASSLGDLIGDDLGPAAYARAGAARFGYVIEAELVDPLDLGHVQAAWALAKCVCEAAPGAVVLDVFGAQAHVGEEVAALDPDRAFRLMHEVAIMVDDAHPPCATIVTRGLIKFGRPDLVVDRVPVDQVAGAAQLVREIAEALADGELLEPGDHIELPDDPGGFAVDVLPDDWREQLGLERGLLLTPS
ncbi:MAG: hypothetical protein KA297_08205 [Kofleriaceae bacterium]|jgi:hypothetical protein|nr:hypothetical protein [Kofleriaceae bacterium]MBP6838217.1 hypothetical protein [Kofleriaceae bacterium]